jgi:hypothetical protein
MFSPFLSVQSGDLVMCTVVPVALGRSDAAAEYGWEVGCTDETTRTSSNADGLDSVVPARHVAALTR